MHIRSSNKNPTTSKPLSICICCAQKNYIHQLNLDSHSGDAINCAWNPVRLASERLFIVYNSMRAVLVMFTVIEIASDTTDRQDVEL